MKTIHLKQIRLARFRSFVADTVIPLSTGAGLKFITGDNKVEPRLGANGAGKSTIWDAVCWCLTGASVRGLRATDLTSHGQKDLTVELTLAIDDEEFVVKRTSPPARLYLDGEQISQEQLDQLIGLSRSRFLNSVLFGQAVPLFMDLPVPARGDLLDEVLNLELWMAAANKATEKHSAKSRELNTLRTQLAHTRGQLEGLPDLASLREQEQGWEEQRKQRLDALIAQFEEVEQGYNTLINQEINAELKDVSAVKHEYDLWQDKVAGFQRQAAVLHAEKDRAVRDVQFFEDNDACPTCGQEITDADEHVKALKIKIRELNAQLERCQLDVRTSSDQRKAMEITWQAAIRFNADIERQREILDVKRQQKTREMSNLEQQAQTCHDAINPFSTQRQEVETRRAGLEILLQEQLAGELAAVSTLTKLDFWRQGFRRVRLFCLEKVLVELEVETRNSLLALGLVDWQVAFKTASETRSGTIKLGVRADIVSPDADSKIEMLSGGEMQRARLAVSLGLANLIQRWAGVRYMFEVFDEPTAWLSENGVEDLLEALRSRAETNGRSIWICDHRALYASGFAETYTVIKNDRGSSWQVR